MDNLQLASIIKKYIELCPDIFASIHYQNALENGDRWNIETSWAWLKSRLDRDGRCLVNLDGTTYSEDNNNNIGYWEL
jgi:hypothetical protein